VIVNEGVNKSNHPIQDPLLFITEPCTRDNIHFRGKGHSDMTMPELFQDFVTAAVTNYWKVQLVDLDEILR
jgi:hypothetical protein